jgi:hypothetical protein
MFSIPCPNCRKPLQVTDTSLDRDSQCPACRTVFRPEQRRDLARPSAAPPATKLESGVESPGLNRARFRPTLIEILIATRLAQGSPRSRTARRGHLTIGTIGTSCVTRLVRLAIRAEPTGSSRPGRRRAGPVVSAVGQPLRRVRHCASIARRPCASSRAMGLQGRREKRLVARLGSLAFG